MDRRGSKFSPFDFYNLIGRTGRLFQYFVGKTYYIKCPNDDAYSDKSKAAIDIEFEVTQKTEDVDIQTNSAANNPDVLKYLKGIGMTIDDFQKRIATPIRFEAFKAIRKNYEERKKDLLSETSPWQIVNIVSKIIYDPKSPKINPGIINGVINGKNRSIYSIVASLQKTEYFKNMDVSYLISEIVRTKGGYLEHVLYTRAQIVELFLEKDKVDSSIINKMKRSINIPIESMYYLNSPAKKMLKSIGVYDTDMDIILNYVGDDFGNITELKKRLKEARGRYINSISFISRFETDTLIE